MGEDDFYASISAFTGRYAPINYALCQGQQIAVEQYQALYALIGTTFPGTADGQSTYNLPNLVGGIPIGVGQQQTTGAYTQLGQTGQAAQFALSNGAAAALAPGDAPTIPTMTSVPTLGVNYVICMLGYWPEHP